MTIPIAIIGAGSVGSNLGRGFVDAEYDVVFGVRDPDDHDVSQLAESLGDRARVTTVEAAIGTGDPVVLAVPANVAPDLAATHRDQLAGKTVIDPTNSLATDGMAVDASIAQRIATAAPEATVIKAFNTIGAEWFRDPEVDDVPATMFVSGDDPAAKDTVTDLAGSLGFDPIDVGALSTAHHLEHLARFWIHLSRTYGRDIAFRLLGG